MRTGAKRLLTMVLILAAAVMLFTGCSAKPKPEDAQAYVKAVLDIICTGDYDHSVNLADIEEGKETEIRDQIVEKALESLSGDTDLSEERTEEFKQIMIDALAAAKYTVGDAVETEDGGYDVAVTIEAFRLYDGFDENFEKTVTERVQSEPEKVMVMSDAEKTDYVMSIIIELMRANIDDSKYDKAEDITVHYGLLDEDSGQYGCTAEEGQKLGEAIFSTGGIE